MAAEAARAWAALQEQALTAQQRACLTTATRQTDRLWVLLHDGSVNPKPDQASLVIPGRDGQWCRLALSAYDLLLEADAYAHLAHSQTLICVADRTAIEAWLRPAVNGEASTDEPLTVAEPLGLTDVDAANPVAWLSTVLAAAQDERVFGVAGHRIHIAAAPARDGAPLERIRIVVDPPYGPALASTPIALDELVDEATPGVEAAVRALERLADHVSGLFTAQQSAVWHHPPPRPNGADQAAARRGFPTLRVDQAATPPHPPAADSPRPHRPGTRQPR